MPVKRVKDMSQCFWHGKLKADEKPYYWHVYLWEDADAMMENAGPDVGSGSSKL